jgi:hypothetical protein
MCAAGEPHAQKVHQGGTRGLKWICAEPICSPLRSGTVDGYRPAHLNVALAITVSMLALITLGFVPPFDGCVRSESSM